MGALASGGMGAFLAAPDRHVERARQEEPPFTLSSGAKAAVAAGFGALVMVVSRGGQSAVEWAERALTARGVRRPRLWMGVAAAAASLAMSAADMRTAARDQASTSRQDALDGPASSG
ncbi:hypothetical protein [Nocardioides zhouii]|uniref:Uncharacterized protein n=1 Tax=Nocardioides zhouii TaxID=1168729 RepID=A0A4Q2SFB8_9ACTN|nr:hypothetical protein [Nocardioides zhouii]RYC04106.1 hypothetical protein EUA94_20985 [Nocardioides zhouii]